MSILFNREDGFTTPEVLIENVRSQVFEKAVSRLGTFKSQEELVGLCMQSELDKVFMFDFMIEFFKMHSEESYNLIMESTLIIHKAMHEGNTEAVMSSEQIGDNYRLAFEKMCNCDLCVHSQAVIHALKDMIIVVKCEICEAKGLKQQVDISGIPLTPEDYLNSFKMNGE